jgi:DNA modification methylase
MNEVDSESIDLVVTSPPYPMIEMWDDTFSSLNNEIRNLLDKGDGDRAFDLMHEELDKVWTEVSRVLSDGAVACINVGDATRTIAGEFGLYPNHARVTEHFQKAGLTCLPSIIWRKPTNAPTKFMGSGMLPPGAYVTLEHEHILLFRKGGRREFRSKDDRLLRNDSAYFWEERNLWFSDIWTDLRGASQKLERGETRDRSGAFPFEVPYRLINMFSVKDSVVLDPFLGTGTTILAAVASRRNSVGYEIDDAFVGRIQERLRGFEARANRIVDERLARHAEFVKGRDCRFANEKHATACVSGQEATLELDYVKRIRAGNPNLIRVEHQ